MVDSRIARVVVLAAAAAGVTTFGHVRRAEALMKMSTTSAWPGGTMPVCFDATLQAQPGFDRFYTVLRTNVENTWARVANVRFTGWGTCPTPWPAGTAVLYYEVGGFNAQVGYNSTGSTTFKVDFNYKVPGNDNSYPARWASVVVHEFGHLLGFEHEMDRADNPYYAGYGGCTPDGAPWPKPGEVYLTPYDTNSIMEYNVGGGKPGCGIGWTGVASQTLAGLDPSLAWFQPISAWDVAGVQAVYGAKPSGSLVGLGGRCVNIAGDSHAWGTSLIAYDCAGYENDTWSRAQDGVDLTLAARLGSSLMAIDVPNAALSSTGFTSLWDYPLNNSVAQQLTFTNQQWRAYGDMCVVADRAAQNSALRVQTCTGTSSLERFDFEPTGRIRLSGTGFCVNVPYASATSGNPMQLYPCSPSTPYPNEVFKTTTRGELTYGGLCMNVWRGDMTAGSPIALYACSGGAPYPNEVFYTTGVIHGEGGTCLDTFTFPDGISRNMQRIGLATCNGYQSQIWDYHLQSR